jgi:hypothetical protein
MPAPLSVGGILRTTSLHFSALFIASPDHASAPLVMVAGRKAMRYEALAHTTPSRPALRIQEMRRTWTLRRDPRSGETVRRPGRLSAHARCTIQEVCDLQLTSLSTLFIMVTERRPAEHVSRIWEGRWMRRVTDLGGCACHGNWKGHAPFARG